MFEYDKNAEKAAKELDKYDFTKILNSCYDNRKKDLWDIVDKIIEEFPELDVDCGALDNLSGDEIMEYLSEKYNIGFYEITKYQMYYKY